jgi:hypothetical protein
MIKILDASHTPRSLTRPISISSARGKKKVHRAPLDTHDFPKRLIVIEMFIQLAQSPQIFFAPHTRRPVVGLLKPFFAFRCLNSLAIAQFRDHSTSVSTLFFRRSDCLNTARRQRTKREITTRRVRSGGGTRRKLNN